jgi:hypothetical protein
MTWHPSEFKGSPHRKKRPPPSKRKKKGGVRKLRIINPPADEAKARVRVSKDWIRGDIESVILSTASRSTDLRKFNWLAYGQNIKDESLVVTVLKSLGIKNPMRPGSFDRMMVSEVIFDLRDNGQLVYSNRWGWRAA